MSEARDFAWFLWKSWSYLGCNHGSGRWRARREYAAGIVPAALRYIRAVRADRVTHR